MHVCLVCHVGQGKSQAQPDGGEGHSVITTGYPVTVLRKAVAPLRRSNTKARGDLPVRARRQENKNINRTKSKRSLCKKAL